MSQVTDDTRSRVDMGVVRGFVTRSNSKTYSQRLQMSLLSNEAKDGVEHLEPYGFTARPREGAELVGHSIGGNRDHVVVTTVADRRYRVRDLQEGEVCLYTHEGATFTMKNEQVVVLKCKKVEIECDEFTLKCKTLKIDASDSITVTSPSVDVNP